MTDQKSATKSHVANPLRRWFSDGMRFLVPLGCSAGLIIWLFHKVDFREVYSIMRHDVEYGWIGAMMLLTMFSHMIRGYRWGLQLEAAGVGKLRKMTLYVSIFGAYALNLLFPELGEAWRCIFITRLRNVSFSTVFGTDIGDRGSDLAVIIVLIVLALIVAHPAIMIFLHHYALGHKFLDVTESPWLWAVIAAIVGLFWFTFHCKRHYRVLDNAKGALTRIWQGFRVIFTMPHRGLYLILTMGIWICYFLETYVCFFAFPFTRELIHSPGMAYGLLPGLVSFVFSSVSIAIPSNGGLGPWNLAVMFALSLYGVADAEGAAFSMLVWGAQACMLVILGIFSACYIARLKQRNRLVDNK